MSRPKISVVLMLLTPTEFLRAMTEFAIKALRVNADDPNFELVVVEADGTYWAQYDASTRVDIDWRVGPHHSIHSDKYISFNPKIGGVKELNAGIDACTGDYIVFTGNDIFVPPHWDTELLKPFDMYSDCGISSLSAKEPGAIVGPGVNHPIIVEGMYSPFCMWRNNNRDLINPSVPHRMDEAYVKVYQDSDFVMRMYTAGKRAYRNCNAHVHHLARMTSDNVEVDKHKRELAADEETFYQRWQHSPLMIYGMIRYGKWHYGQEHQSLWGPIHRNT